MLARVSRSTLPCFGRHEPSVAPQVGITFYLGSNYSPIDVYPTQSALNPSDSCPRRFSSVGIRPSATRKLGFRRPVLVARLGSTYGSSATLTLPDYGRVARDSP